MNDSTIIGKNFPFPLCKIDPSRPSSTNKNSHLVSLPFKELFFHLFSVIIFRSWLYLFCLRCHGQDDIPSWEPPGWRKACPQPFCPTYRKFARIIALILTGLLCWGIAYTIIGPSAGPGGPLFYLAVLSITAHFGGWLFSLTTLPALIGMLITGNVLQNTGLIHIEDLPIPIVSTLR